MKGFVIVAMLLCSSSIVSVNSFVCGGLCLAGVGGIVSGTVGGLLNGDIFDTLGGLVDKGFGWLGRRDEDLTVHDQKDEFELSLDVALQKDSNDCVFKLVCELGETPDEELSENELFYKNAFGNAENINFHHLTSSLDVYNMALTLGTQLGKNNPMICSQLYSKCPLTREELFTLLDAEFECYKKTNEGCPSEIPLE